MQNKKAATAIGPIGMILVGFIGIMVGLALLTSIASNASVIDDTRAIANTSYTATGAGTYIDIAGCQELIGSYEIFNATDTAALGTSNATLVERVGTDGYKTLSLYIIDGVWNGRTLNVSAVCGVDGYVEDTGARSIISLIVIFVCLAIAAVGLIIALKNGYIDLDRI